MSVSSHDEVNLTLSTLHTRTNKLLQVGQDLLGLLPEPEPGVSGHLVIAAPACVELPCRTANQLRQPPLVRGVNILVSSTDFELAIIPLNPTQRTKSPLHIVRESACQ